MTKTPKPAPADRGEGPRPRNPFESKPPVESAPAVSPEQKSHETLSWAAFFVMTAALVWGYWNSLSEAAVYWNGPQYSHGWMVPLFTGVLLWMRHQPFKVVDARERWWGVGLLLASLVARLVCAHFGFDVPDMVTFVPAMVGVVLIVGGWHGFRWAGPAVVFLIFMFPLPWSVENALLNPLQGLATKLSTYSLQTLGVEAYHEGNRINIGELQLGVVDACSGLRMCTIFVALTVAIVLITERPWWQRIVILLSAIPIALAVNTIRITATGLLHLTAGSEWANYVFHDLAGWLMMPMALIMLFVELQILSSLFIDVELEEPAAMFSRGG